jgi:hypothetical protein
MNKKTKKIILTILSILLFSSWLSHFLADGYFFSISPSNKNIAMGTVYVINHHGSLAYINYNQQLFLNVTEDAFFILFALTIFLGIRWKLMHRSFDEEAQLYNQRYGENNEKKILHTNRKSAEKKPYIGPRHTVLALASLFCLFIGFNEIGHRLLIETEGTIISFKYINHSPTYIILGSNGIEKKYIIGPTDSSLPKNIANGTHIKKDKYKLTWQKNGALVNDFPLTVYLGACVLGFLLAFWAAFQWRLNRPNRI